jgi:hypothetical protein
MPDEERQNNWTKVSRDTSAISGAFPARATLHLPLTLISSVAVAIFSGRYCCGDVGERFSDLGGHLSSDLIHADVGWGTLGRRRGCCGTFFCFLLAVGFAFCRLLASTFFGESIGLGFGPAI